MWFPLFSKSYRNVWKYVINLLWLFCCTRRLFDSFRIITHYAVGLDHTRALKISYINMCNDNTIEGSMVRLHLNNNIKIKSNVLIIIYI